MREKGISRDSTVVFYGDKSNWWAAYALWAFSLFGHSDLRLLDGGRAKWEAEGRPMTTDAPERTPTDYPVVDGPSIVTRLAPDLGGVDGIFCDNTALTSWRNHVDVDVIGEIDTAEKPMRQQDVYCRVF